MPQSLVKILVHVIFSTKNRGDLITPEIENSLYGCFHGIIENNDAKLIIANVTKNYIHLLISLGRKIDISELIGVIKRNSSVWIKQQNAKFADFHWQRGYVAFSIGQSQNEIVTKYIKHQKEHHQKQSFEDEYRTLLKKYEIDYGERYVWD